MALKRKDPTNRYTLPSNIAITQASPASARKDNNLSEM